MKKILTKKFLLYLLIVILALVVAYLSYSWGKGTWPFGEQKYQAVRLINGDVFYGRLHFFPSPKLFDAYFVQNVPAQKEGEQLGSQLSPISSLFFSPENTMYFSKNQILWWADLSKDSQILKAIREMRGK